MSMKKFDLAKSLALKVAGQMKTVGVPDRFAQGAADALDRREQRKRDAAAGLVPFACKLPSELTRRLQEMAPGHEGGLNALMAELLNRALGEAGEDAAPAKAPAKKAAAPKAAKPASADEAGDKEAAPRKAAAKKAAEKKAAEKAAPAAKKAVSRKP